jgi:alpha-tubulin suppressor-like RCC1 family protein
MLAVTQDQSPSHCKPATGTTARRLRPLLLLPALAALACQEDTTPITAPSTKPSAAINAEAALTFKQLAVGSFHSCGITASTNVAYCWGSNNFGQLGDGTTTNSNRPRRVAGGLTFKLLTLGANHTCGVTTTGVTYCWGGNYSGQLGDGTLTNRLTPTRVHTSSLAPTLFAVTAGNHHTCAIGASGPYANLAFCWGWNKYGQLGDGTTTDRLTPVPVSPPAGGSGRLFFINVSAGGLHTCGVTSFNATLCWGNNSYGQLGDLTNTDKLVPTYEITGGAWSYVDAGYLHTCGQRTNGSVYCWGRNFYGELGDGTNTDKNAPVPVLNAVPFTRVNAGTDNSCAVTSTSTIHCWGRGDLGQIGNGGTTGFNRPTPVAGGQAFRGVAVGRGHVCGRNTSNLLFCWGYNLYGELGDGTNTNRLTPTAVVGP